MEQTETAVHIFGPAVAAAQDIHTATGIPCTVIDDNGAVVFPSRLRDYPCWMCRIAGRSVRNPERLAADHAEKGRQAFRIGSEQIFLCRSNLTHWVAPIISSGEFIGAFVGGPVRMAEGDTSFEQDVMVPLRRESEIVARTQQSDLQTMYDRIPIVPAPRISALARDLYRTALGVSGLMTQDSRHERLERESRISEYIQQLKAYRQDHGMQEGIPTYPLDTEQALLNAIRTGDGERAQAILNELLGHVFFALGADLERIKVRAREIVILLSRIVIARGADANRVFGFNYRALDELDGLEDLNDVAHWMARIVRGFTGTVLRLPAGARHTTLLRRVLDYVEESFRGRVRLSAAAALAGVSTAYLSRVFRAEMGETFSAYVRRVRVKHAQDLLSGTNLPISDIADSCGFSDQSHLTMAFRKTTGTTPAEFRKTG